jgi:type II secretory pathway pseudopilin PulG
MIKNEKGFALLLVLVTMLIMAVLGTVLISVSTSQVKEAVKQQDRIQAHYLAYYGAQATVDWILSGNIVPEGSSNTVTLDNGSFAINVDTSNQDQLLITAQGTVNSYSETVNVLLTKQGGGSSGEFPFPTDMAIFAIGQGTQSNPAIKLTGSSKIIGGDAGTNSTGANSVQFDSSTLLEGGDLYIGPGGDPAAVVQQGNNQSGNLSGGSIIPLEAERVYPSPTFPDFPNNLSNRGNFSTPWVSGEYYLINDDGQYGTISATSNRTITIDMDGGDRVIRTGTLNISQGHINLINVGENSRLTLYVESSFSLGGSSTINDGGSVGNVMMYYKGLSTPNLAGDTRYVGNYFAESAGISIGGSNGIVGHIIAMGNSVTVTGDARMLTRVLYAPNAHVEINGSGAVTGSIIANSVSVLGNSRVYYEQPDLGLFPIEIFPSDGNDNNGGENGNNSTWGNPQWSGGNN